MRAVVLSAPGPVENLQIRQLRLPEPEPGWVRIKVEAFGLKRSELHTRLGLDLRRRATLKTKTGARGVQSV